MVPKGIAKQLDFKLF